MGSGGLGYNLVGASPYYVYFFFYDWNPYGLTGTNYINFTTANAAKSWNGLGETLGYVSTRSAGTPSMGFSTYEVTNGLKLAVQSVVTYPPTINNKYSKFSNYWNISTFSDYFTRTFVSKQVTGYNYTSRVYVMSKNVTVASESALGIINYTGIFSQSPISLSILDTYGRWWNTTSYYLSNLSFGLTVNPDIIAKGAATRIIIESATPFDSVDYIFLWDLTSKETISIGKFKHITGSVWQKYSDLTKTYVTTSLNPADYYYSPITSGNHTIKAGIYTGSTSYDVSDNLFVESDVGLTNPVLISINAHDATTQGYLTNYILNVKDTDKEIWYNFTNVELTKELAFNIGTSLYGEVIKEHYYLGKSNYTVPNLPNYSFGTYWGIPVYPLSIPTANTTLTVEVQNYLYNPLPNALVSLSDGQFKNTGANADLVQFTLANNTIYTIQVSALGYGTITDIFNTTNQIVIKKTYRLNLPVTPQYTPTVTLPYPTPTPFVTVTGGIVINGTFVKTPTNLIESIDYMLCTQAGICDKSTMDLTKAAMIILAIVTLLCYIGRNTDNLGMLALVGASIGFVISLVLGFIPLWVLLAMLGLGFIVAILLRQG